jgi:hypothetical protein
MANLGLGIDGQEKSPEGLKIEKYSLTYIKASRNASLTESVT